MFQDLDNRKLPYDACKAYGKSLSFWASGKFRWQIDGADYSFNLHDISVKAAATWATAIQNFGCGFSIIDSGVTLHNFVITDDLPVDSTATTVPAGYAKLAQREAGIYVSAKPVVIGANDAKTLRQQFDASMVDEDIARALSVMVMVHEFGHALGLAHPVEQSGPLLGRDIPRTYSPYSLKWRAKQTFERAPIMIGNNVDLLSWMAELQGGRRLTMADMQPSLVEANTLAEIMSCVQQVSLRPSHAGSQCPSFLSEGVPGLRDPSTLLGAIGLLLEEP